MRKIAICGCGGSGKSMLARQLGQRLGLPVTHLDMIFYDEDWNALDQEEFAARQHALVTTDAWVIDGNYSATMPVRLAAADTVIFLDVPAVTCLWSILRRRRQHRGNDKLSRHLRGRLSWGFVTYIIRYRKNMRPKMRRLFDEHATGVVVTLTSRRAVRRYLRSIPAEHSTRGGSWS